MRRMELASLVALVALLASPAFAARTGISSLSQAQTTQTGSCDACLFGFRLLDDVLGDQAVQDDMVNFVLTRVCPAVGGGEKCTNLAEGLLPVVIDWIRMPATAWQFCSATGSCDSTQHASLKLALTTARQPTSKLDDPTQCALCKLVVSQVQQVLNNTAVLDKINATAQQVCLQLPPDMAVMCANFVDTYEPLIAALIAHASPEELCEMLGVCAAQLMSRLSAAQLPPLQGDVQAIVSSAISKGAVPGLTGAGMFTDSCDMCKMAVIEAHSIVVNPQIQSQLTNYTEALCESFGPSFADTCKLYVDTYAPVVYSVLAQYLVPDTLCVEIGVCPPPSKVFGVLGSLLSSVRTAIGTNTEAHHLVTQHVAEAAARKWARQQAV